MNKPQHEKTTQDFIKESITVAELRKLLNKFPAQTKVFISSDSEGNSYGTLAKEMQYTVMYSAQDNALALMQFCDHLDDADIMPIQDAQIMAQLEAEQMKRDAQTEARAS